MSDDDFKMTATSREPEEYARATEAARETRAGVAEQFRALIIEGDQMGGRGAFTHRVQKIIEAEQRIRGAHDAARHARQIGISPAAAVRAETEAREALRAAVVDAGVAAAQWAAAIDHEAKRRAESLTFG